MSNSSKIYGQMEAEQSFARSRSEMQRRTYLIHYYFYVINAKRGEMNSAAAAAAAAQIFHLPRLYIPKGSDGELFSVPSVRISHSTFSVYTFLFPPSRAVSLGRRARATEFKSAVPSFRPFSIALGEHRRAFVADVDENRT